MKTINRYFFTYAIVALFIGCNDPQKQQQPIKQEPNSQVSGKQNNEPSAEAPNAVSNDFAGLTLSKKDPMSPKELAGFLPNTFGGEDFPVSMLNSERDGYSISMARKQYTTARKGTITVSITDYGGSALLNTGGYEMPDPRAEIGIQIEKITLPYGVGYKTFNTNNNSGIIAALVGGRFGIDIEAAKMPDNFGDILQILEKVNIDGLLKKAK